MFKTTAISALAELGFTARSARSFDSSACGYDRGTDTLAGTFSANRTQPTGTPK
jgi:hypothetical protein